MNTFRKSTLVALGISSVCWAARCTTVLDPNVMRAYEEYVARTEQGMPPHFDARELSWVPSVAAGGAEADLASGKLVRWNISDAVLNQRIAGRNGTVLHWIGGMRIQDTSLPELESVLRDYDLYDQFYRPLVFEWKAKRDGAEGGPPAVYDALLGLQSTFRFASLFLQRYAFRVNARIDYSSATSVLGVPELRVHLKAGEIRESDSGVQGRTDFLEPYHDHGIMWALNAYWRARQTGTGIYLEFETITLARSVQAFACKVGFIPVPKSIVSAAMDSLPADSVTVILEGTKAECHRRAMKRRLRLSSQ